jgi:hypothetical protein
VVPKTEVCGNGKDDDCDGATDENLDEDGDGWGACDGDCCDSLASGCAVDPAKVNPGAYDFPGNYLDDDCDGTFDNVSPRDCSPNTVTSNISADGLVRAMDLCQFTSGDPEKWGVISASLSLAGGSGTPEQQQLGILKKLGGSIAPLQGQTLAVMSSGTGRGVGDAAYVNPYDPGFDADTLSTAPTAYTSAHGGMLQTVAGCPSGETSVRDSVQLRLRLRAPTNANGFQFKFRFFSAEYPEYLCSSYNDFFLVLMHGAHSEIPADHNISFDANGSPVSVNNAFFTTCLPKFCGYLHDGVDLDDDGCPDSLECRAGYCATVHGACPDGAADLAAFENLYDMAGATSWLTTTAPVVPGEEFYLEFYIWDTSDQWLDSLVIIDDFQWRIDPTKVETFN